jgi:hypothetical protein
MPELSREDLDVLMEIRSRLKDDTGQKLALSGRDIYHELEAFWYITPNAITKSKIRNFLNSRNIDWNDPLAV